MYTANIHHPTLLQHPDFEDWIPSLYTFPPKVDRRNFPDTSHIVGHEYEVDEGEKVTVPSVIISAEILKDIVEGDAFRKEIEAMKAYLAKVEPRMNALLEEARRTMNDLQGEITGIETAILWGESEMSPELESHIRDLNQGLVDAGARIAHIEDFRNRHEEKLRVMENDKASHMQHTWLILLDVATKSGLLKPTDDSGMERFFLNKAKEFGEDLRDSVPDGAAMDLPSEQRVPSAVSNASASATQTDLHGKAQQSEVLRACDEAARNLYHAQEEAENYRAAFSQNLENYKWGQYNRPKREVEEEFSRIFWCRRAELTQDIAKAEQALVEAKAHVYDLKIPNGSDQESNFITDIDDEVELAEEIRAPMETLETRPIQRWVKACPLPEDMKTVYRDDPFHPEPFPEEHDVSMGEGPYQNWDSCSILDDSYKRQKLVNFAKNPKAFWKWPTGFEKAGSQVEPDITPAESSAEHELAVPAPTRLRSVPNTSSRKGTKRKSDENGEEKDRKRLKRQKEECPPANKLGEKPVKSWLRPTAASRNKRKTV